jgi:predicted signal transduction protein with EAL and GGDEF domain
MAHHDMLIGQPNRAMLSDKMAEVPEQFDDNGNSLALLFLDLDRFKLINDTLGLPAGDALIKCAARRELGFVGSMGAWVLRQACLDAVGFLGTAKMAVDLPPIQLEDDAIVSITTQALAESGLDPTRLEVEITESTLLNGSATTIPCAANFATSV